ncbi:MAG: AAA family ATPase [Deltaproteobacteria bacterium]|jgi:hypothetical protein|nr:AAA family ATPase [Deltaproteobacteria bacterium]
MDRFIPKLNALKLCSFDWVKSVEDVWTLSPTDAPALQAPALAEFSLDLMGLLTQESALSPPGIVIAGPGGSGKTHLLSRFAKTVFQNGGYFFLADFSDLDDALETVARGVVKSLLTPIPALEGRAQISRLLEKILSFLKLRIPPGLKTRYHSREPSLVAGDATKILARLAPLYPRETLEHQDALRTVLLLNSPDPELARHGQNWAQGFPLTRESQQIAGYRGSRGEAARLLAGFFFFLSLGGEISVLAVDQLDGLLSLERVLARAGPVDDPQGQLAAARSAFADVSDALGKLPSLTRRCLTVLSALPLTWESLETHSPNASLERYRRPPLYLSPLRDGTEAEALIAGRARPAAHKAGLAAPYPSWPFAPEALQDAVGLYPRELLALCHGIVRRKILQEDVRDVATLWETGPAPLAVSSPAAPGKAPSAPGAAFIPTAGDGLFVAWEESPRPPAQEEENWVDSREPAAERAPEAPLGPRPAPEGGPFMDDGETSDSPYPSRLPESPAAGDETPSDPIAELEASFRALWETGETDPYKEENAGERLWPRALAELLETFQNDYNARGNARLALDAGLDGPEDSLGLLALAKGPPGQPPDKELFLRVLTAEDPGAFAAKLRLSLDRAGIARKDRARRLLVLRFTPKPAGPAVAEIIEEFSSRGGIFGKPSDQDIAILAAFLKIKAVTPRAALAPWAKALQPWNKVLFLREALSWLS